MNLDPIEPALIALTRQLVVIRSDRTEQAEMERESISAKIRLVGQTAAFFGGIDGMRRLHDACEAMTGKTNEIGGVLNDQWDRISSWSS